jgi:CubicO group peptidase (beta-lactamase class C family)
LPFSKAARAVTAAFCIFVTALAPASSGAQSPAAPAVSPAVRPPAPKAARPPAEPPAPIVAAPGVTPMVPAELEAFVDGAVRDAMSRDHIAGVTVSVVQNGQVVLKKGYGFDRLTPGRAVDPDRTLFRIASISKTFTWILMMREVEAGRVRLDGDINLYLPQAARVPDQGYDRQVRVIDLMTHQPGFEDRALGQLFEKDPKRVRPLLTYLRQERPRRVRAPGALPSYSNYGLALAGEAEAYLNGMTFPNLVETRITGPLGMTRTTFREPYPPKEGLPGPMPASLSRDVSEGYVWTGGGFSLRGFEFASQVAPAGGASTTAADMARYMLMILNDGGWNGATIYSPGTAAGFRQPLRPYPGVNGWAHGFNEYSLPGGYKGYGHGGDTLLFHSQMVTVPALNLGVFISTNTDTGARLAGELPGMIVQRFYAARDELQAPGSDWLKANAGAFSGEYLATRRAYHGLEKLVGLINSRAKVSVNRTGHLVIQGFDRRTVWSPIDQAGHFRELGGWRTLTFEMKDGRAVRWYASGGSAAFNRAGFWHNQTLMLLAALATVIAALATLLGVIFRDRRDFRQTTPQSRASLVQNIQAVLFLVAIGEFGLWAAKAGDVTAIFYDWPGGLLLTGASFAFVATVLQAVVLVLIPFIWRGGRRVDSWTTGRKLRFCTTAAVFTLFALLLALWGGIYPWAA